MKNEIMNLVNYHIEEMKKLQQDEYTSKIENIIDMHLNCINNGGKILIAGNGGSASDAQHYAGELVGRFLLEREGIPAIALNTDTSVMTCISNDYKYEDVFSRQINALGNKNDIFIGISTSGNSKNIVEAVKEAKRKGLITIGFLGKDGGLLKDICDETLIIPFNSTARVQEAHILSIHIICELVEKVVASKNEKQ